MTANHNPPHNPAQLPKERIIVHSWDEVPVFANEREEHGFWSTHEMSDALFENVDPDALAELPPPRARGRGPQRHAAG